MLLEFSVRNYKSFRDLCRFSMVAAKISARDKHIDENNVCRVDDDLSLLTSAAVYGANASGKSNLTAALNFMRRFVSNSSKDTQAMEPIGVEEFRLSTETAGQPSFFEVVFLLGGKKHRYGFEVDRGRVVSEWLHHVPTVREAALFTRSGDNIILSSSFREGRGIKEKTRKNALFLSVVAQFNGQIAQDVLGWFMRLNVISGITDDSTRGYTLRSFEGSHYRNDIIRFVKELDLGISDLHIEKTKLTPEALPSDMPSALKDLILTSTEAELVSVRTTHRKYDAEGNPAAVEIFDLDVHESQGTQKLFNLAGPVIDTLSAGKILIIDELDARLHPLITLAIVGLFNSKRTNPHNAQLVFTTQDTGLLSNKVFRRDQIWFTEKDARGATHLYSLAEYRVRNDESFGKHYLSGKYGAIPFIGDLQYVTGKADA
ncbi:MAG: ATP-binding protein [Chloroflexota bacterium]|nr:MAG: ATP-binding protein [Chloroflexota bacterium]